MKFRKKNNSWFTIIELLVSITIFSIIMVSVIDLYIISTKTTYKSDINRIIHENIKSVVTEISEDITKNGIFWVSENKLSNCKKVVEWNVLSWNKACIWDNTNSYFLWKEVFGSFIRAEKIECDDYKNPCYILKNTSWDIQKITNSLVNVKDLKFYITDNWVKKLTISIILEASSKSGVKDERYESGEKVFKPVIFQTTLSDRPKYNIN